MRVYQIVNDRCFQNHLSFKNRLIYQIGAATGLRVSDVIALKKEQIMRTNRPTIIQQKTKKKKRLYFGDKLYSDILRFIKADKNRDNPYIFNSVNSKDNHITRQAVWKAFTRAAKKAGVIYPVGTHCMRKKYSAKKYNASGGDITAVQHHLQHYKSVDTLAYILPPPTKKKKRGKKKCK